VEVDPNKDVASSVRDATKGLIGWHKEVTKLVLEQRQEYPFELP